MSEGIANRVARIVAGSAHALIDKAEDLAPETVMAQSIREVEIVVDELRADMGKSEAGKHLVVSQIAKLNAEHERLAEQIDVAIAQARDDLACAAIGRQSDIEDQLPVLQRTLEEQSERSEELESYIVALQAKQRELEQVLADFIASRSDGSEVVGSSPGQGRQQRVDKAAASFDRVMARQTGVAGLNGPMLSAAGKLKELAELHRSNRIAERLAAIKATRDAA